MRLRKAQYMRVWVSKGSRVPSLTKPSSLTNRAREGYSHDCGGQTAPRGNHEGGKGGSTLKIPIKQQTRTQKPQYCHTIRVRWATYEKLLKISRRTNRPLSEIVAIAIEQIE